MLNRLCTRRQFSSQLFSPSTLGNKLRTFVSQLLVQYRLQFENRRESNLPRGGHYVQGW